TRFSRDWSSDVCSSDLDAVLEEELGVAGAEHHEIAQQADFHPRVHILLAVVGAECVDGERKPLSARLKQLAGDADAHGERHVEEIGRASWRGRVTGGRA